MGCSHSIDKNKPIFSLFNQIRENNYVINKIVTLGDDKKIILFNNGIFNTYSLFNCMITDAEIAHLYNNYCDVTKMKPVKKIKIKEVLYLKSIQYDKALYHKTLYSFFYMEKKQLDELFGHL